MSEPTYWNFEPTPARIVRVIVGKSLRPTWWCAGLEGQEREAVEVTYFGDVFYLDNEKSQHNIPGGGWAKVTHGRGSPGFGHSELPVRKVLAEVAPDDSENVKLMRTPSSKDTHP